MSFTIEDALVFTKELYKIKLVAGKNGIKNQISWVHLLEDTTIINQFWGNEMAVTTGFGFRDSEQLLNLIKLLNEHKSAGLIINIGKYIEEIPDDVKNFCEVNNFPLLTIPWEIYLADLIKDFCIRTFTSQKEDQKIIRILTGILKNKLVKDATLTDLASMFDFGEPFFLFHVKFPYMEHVDFMERHKIRFQIQSILDKEPFTNILFPYESTYILIINGLNYKSMNAFRQEMTHFIEKFIPLQKYYIGCSDCFYDFKHIINAYEHAKAATQMAINKEINYIDFIQMGMESIWYSFPDKSLLKHLYYEYLAPLINYDKAHNSNYETTLFFYLKYNGSIQAIAKELFTHRNTIQYRMNKIKELLDCNLEDAKDRFNYQLAFYIKDSFPSE